MRFKSLFYPLFFISLCLVSCEFKCSVGESSTARDDKKTKPVQKDGMALYNGIKLEAREVKVNKAYLVTKDDRAERIDEGNFVDVKKGVKLMLLIDEGWKVTNDRVWLDATMEVTADTGERIFETKDLFKSFPEGLTVKDAKALGLSFYLTELTADRPVSFDISFRVWDKKGNGLIEGGYTVHTK